MCMCGALDCRRCHPENWINIDGRVRYIEDIEEDVEHELRNTWSGKRIGDFVTKRGRLWDDESGFIEVADLDYAQFVNVARELLYG